MRYWNKKKAKIFLFSLICIISFFVIWYYMSYSFFSKKNFFGSIKILFLSNNYNEYTYKKTNVKFVDNNFVLTLTVNITKGDNQQQDIKIYDLNNNLIMTLNYSDCIIKDRKKCTYLVNSSGVNKIYLSNKTPEYTSINNVKYINQFKKKLMINLLYSLLIVSCTFLIFIFFNKIKLLKKVTFLFDDKNIARTFILFAMIFGIISSILIPLYQVPDELTHINLIYKERKIEQKFEYFLDKPTGAENIIGNINYKVNTHHYFNFNNRINVLKKFSLPSVMLLRHFPQCIGMIVGEIFHFPLFLYITFAEICALVFYVFMGFISLRIIPFNKKILFFIMLLPISIQQMASFSYDCTLNACCFFFISYILYLIFSKEKIYLRNIVLLLFILIIIAICKIPYILIGCLIFTLPYKKIVLNNNCVLKIVKHIKKNKIKYSFSAMVMIFLILLTIIPCLKSNGVVKILIASLEMPIVSFKLCCRTIISQFISYSEQIIGCLGWFDTPLPKLFVIYSYAILILLIFGEKNLLNDNNMFKLKNKILIVFTIIVILYLIFISMIDWTLFSSGIREMQKLSVYDYKKYIRLLNIIAGVQGRYFIPILPLIFVFISSQNKFKNNISDDKINFMIIIYYIVLFIVLISTLLNRYWI